MISKSEYHAVEAVEFEVVKHFVDSDSYSNTWIVVTRTESYYIEAKIISGKPL